MSFIKPIPKYLLRDTITYKPVTFSETANEYLTSLTIKNVKFHKMTSKKLISDGVIEVSNGMFCIDGRNSIITETNERVDKDLLTIDSIIIHDNREYLIVDIKTHCCDNAKPHHWEVVVK